MTNDTLLLLLLLLGAFPHSCCHGDQEGVIGSVYRAGDGNPRPGTKETSLVNGRFHDFVAVRFLVGKLSGFKLVN